VAGIEGARDETKGVAEMKRRSEAQRSVDALAEDFRVRVAELQEKLRLELGRVMKATRTEAGLRQADVAEKLGVSQGWVSKLESSVNNHTIESVAAYFAAVGADLDLVAWLGGSRFPIVSSGQEVLRGRVLDGLAREMLRAAPSGFEFSCKAVVSREGVEFDALSTAFHPVDSGASTDSGQSQAVWNKRNEAELTVQ